MQDLIFPAVGRWVGAQREWDNLVAELRTLDVGTDGRLTGAGRARQPSSS